MPTESKVEVKSKGQLLGEFDYVAPDSLEEGLQMDGEEKVFKYYAAKRKIEFLNTKRRELTGGGLPKALIAALKSAEPDVLKKIAEEMGLDLE